MKKIIFFPIIAIIFLISIAFSTLSVTLDISGEGVVKGEKDIKIINISSPNSTHFAYEIYNARHTDKTINTSVRLPTQSSYIEYYGTIKNNSYSTMEIFKIDKTISNKNVNVRLIGLKENDIIDINSSLVFKIVIEYNDNVQVSDYFKEISSMIEITFKEYESVINTKLITLIDENYEINNCVEKDMICQGGTLLKIKVNNSETVDFITISDDGTNITLMTSQILTTSQWTKNNYHFYGPNTLLENLNQSTSTWANIKKIDNYSWNNKGSSYRKINITNGLTTINNYYNDDEIIAGITRAIIPSSINLTNYEYWTIINGSNYKTAKIVNKNGSFEEKRINQKYGIRPLITIEKWLKKLFFYALKNTNNFTKKINIF